MIVPFEVLLVLGALAFYLQDSCALLYADELMLERVGTGWRVRPGAALLIAGRRPFLPNPLAPHRPLVRVSLQQLLGEGPGGRNSFSHYVNSLGPFRRASIALLWLFVAGLPLVMHFFGTGTELLGWLALVYLVLMRMIAALFQHRRVLQLSVRVCAGIAFECVCCPPVAINIVRKLTLRAEPLRLQAYPALVDARTGQSLATAAGERIEEMLSLWELESPQARVLLHYRERLLSAGGVL